jgi:hypothetical protein
MTNQRLISDARRRARALSVETGRAYQTHLDDVARLAGRTDWKAFVADPAPLPPPGMETNSTPPTATRSGMRSRLACIAGAAIAATIPIAAAAAILLDSDRMNEQSERVAAEATMLAHVHAPLVGIPETRTFSARIEIPDARRRIVTLAITDLRVAGASRFLRYLPGRQPLVFVGDQLGGQIMRDALSTGAVMRLVVEVDCQASTTRYLRYEAARDMTSRPIIARSIPDARRPHPIESAMAITDVCSAPATPPIHIG